MVSFFKVPPQIPGRKSVDGVGSDGVGHAKHAREDSPDVSPGFRFNGLIVLYLWQFAQIFGDYKMPAVVSKRGFLVGLSPAGARELELFYHKEQTS